jgi:hypothetical protein
VKGMSSRSFQPTPAFRKKEEQLRQSVLLKTKEKLKNDMQKLFKDPEYCDVVLVSQSNELPVHSVIIEARFPEFYKHIQDQPEPQSRKVNIKEMPFADLERWAKTLYSDDDINRSFIEEMIPLNEKRYEKEDMGSKEDVSLSSDLLSLLNETGKGDVEFSVGGKTVRGHKAILAARSDYFAAMFSSSWREASQESSISIPDVSYEVFLAALKFIYGASQEILSFPAAKVLRLADMYGMQDMVDLIVVDLKITKCHLFHKPCTHCIPQVYECLKLCEPFYHTKDFQSQCLQWISKNFQKTLACRQFPLMSDHFQNEVQEEIRKEVSSSTVPPTMWLKCNTLTASLKNLNTSWTQTVLKFVGEIREICLIVIVENFPVICEFSTISTFVKEIRNSSSLLEQFLNEILEKLTVGNCCHIFQSLQKILERATAMDESERHYFDPFDHDSLQVVRESLKRCEKFIVSRIGPVSQTNAWKDISPTKQQELKSRAFFVDL